MPHSKEHSLATDPKEKKIDKFPGREFKIMILRKLKKVGENTNTQFNEIKKTIHNLHEKFSRDKDYK